MKVRIVVCISIELTGNLDYVDRQAYTKSVLISTYTYFFIFYSNFHQI